MNSVLAVYFKMQNKIPTKSNGALALCPRWFWPKTAFYAFLHSSPVTVSEESDHKVMDPLPEDTETKDLVGIMLQMSFWPGLIESCFSARKESRKNPISVLERV